MSSQEQIIRNAIQTPDSTILESYNRHDYKSYVDANANGETYFIDGGLDYIRTSVNKESAKLLTLYESDEHEVIREHLKWGSYGKYGDQELKFIPLCDMETDHILAVFDTVPIPEWRKRIYLTELKLRNVI